MTQTTQNKALRIINFKQSMESSEPFYQKVKINNLKNNIILSSCLFVVDTLTNNLPDVFDQFFQPLKEHHNHYTRGSQQYLLNIPKINIQTLCSNSIKVKSRKNWNEIIHKIHFSSEHFFLNVLNLSNLLKVPSMTDDSKIRLRYNILFMKPESSSTAKTF